MPTTGPSHEKLQNALITGSEESPAIAVLTSGLAAAVAVNVTQTTNIAAAVAVNATQTTDIDAAEADIVTLQADLATAEADIVTLTSGLAAAVAINTSQSVSIVNLNAAFTALATKLNADFVAQNLLAAFPLTLDENYDTDPQA